MKAHEAIQQALKVVDEEIEAHRARWMESRQRDRHERQAFLDALWALERQVLARLDLLLIDAEMADLRERGCR